MCTPKVPFRYVEYSPATYGFRAPGTDWELFGSACHTMIPPNTTATTTRPIRRRAAQIVCGASGIGVGVAKLAAVAAAGVPGSANSTAAPPQRIHELRSSRTAAPQLMHALTGIAPPSNCTFRRERAGSATVEFHAGG